MKHIIFILILVALSTLRLFGQKPNEQLRFQSYTVEQGLSQNIVEAVIQDCDRFMWFGTQDGLNRFDGKNFKTFYFKIDDTASLSNNYIKALFEDFGVGIKEEYRDKIFDMFFIATDKNPGTGLGLYSVKMAVKKLGGSIVVDPSFEQSSGFLLQLPFPQGKYSVKE